MKIEVHDGVTSTLTAMANAVEHPRAILDGVGQLVRSSTQLRFDESHGPGGKPWAPVLRGGQPLRNKGVHLRNAMSVRATDKDVRVGVPYQWAAVHQFGAVIRAKNAPFLRFKVAGRWASKKSVRIPARPFFGVDSEDASAIVAYLQRRLFAIGRAA